MAQQLLRVFTNKEQNVAKDEKEMKKKVEGKMEATKKPAKKSMPMAPKSNRKKMVEDDGF